MSEFDKLQQPNIVFSIYSEECIAAARPTIQKAVSCGRRCMQIWLSFPRDFLHHNSLTIQMCSSHSAVSACVVHKFCNNVAD